MLELRVSALILQPEEEGGPKASRKTRHSATEDNVRRHIDTILASGIRDSVVVANKPSPALARAFRGLPVRFSVHSPEKGGLDESVRIGIKCLGDSPSGILFCRTDDPVPSVRLIRNLALDHYAFCNKIIAPALAGTRGHPLLFPRPVLQEALSGSSIEEIISKDPRRIRMSEVPDFQAPVANWQERKMHNQAL